MPKPLRSKDKNGEPFARPPEIDACLQRLESVDAKTRLRAFAISSRKSDGYVPSEAPTRPCSPAPPRRARRPRPP